MALRLFDEQISRKPNLYPWVEEYVSSMQNGFWTDKEFNFQSDVQDFKVNLSEQEREIITKTLSAIGQIEVAVKTFWVKLGENFKHPSINDLGIVMGNTEVIHNNAYERLLNILGIEEIFEENLKVDVISGRVNYLKKYNHKYYADSKKQYIYALTLFTLFIENVSLFGQFYIMLWFGRYRNVLKDVNQMVLYTKNEELIHAQVGIKLINILRKEYPELFDSELEDRVIDEAKNAFLSESKIIDWILEGYEGNRINSDILKEYIKSRINDSLSQIGYKKIFEIDKRLARDFEWMDEEVHGNNATDFFFKRPIEYAKKNKSFAEEDLF